MELSIFKDNIEVNRAPLAKKNGMQYRDWDQAATHTVTKVQITPQSTTQDLAGRTAQTTDKRTLRARHGADIEPGDRIVWSGQIYEIDGEVFRTKSPTGRVSSTRCTLVRWEG